MRSNSGFWLTSLAVVALGCESPTSSGTAVADTTTADSTLSGTDAADSAGIDGPGTDIADTGSTDAPDTADASCTGADICGTGAFCNDLGHCCPALGCGPQCPNGILIDANGCDTCQCAPAKTLSYFTTCGYPVCAGNWSPTTGVPLCTTEQAGATCSTEGQQCDAKTGCGVFLKCAASDPKAAGCPKSRASLKSDVHYLDAAERQSLAAELLDTRLATYRYTAGGRQAPRHLGFLIDDQPNSPAVDAKRDMVDLYGYLSLSVATLQEQQKQIEQLRTEIQELRNRCGP